jgi:zinc transport system substrate-binding protein
VSIQPLHSLVAAVMEGAGSPELLLPPAMSPHAYALRPSDAALLAGADVVFWAGPGLEVFLERPLSVLGAQSTAIALEDAPGVSLLPAQAAGIGGEDGQVEAEGTDVHFWLDPRNAGAIATAAAAALGSADPANAAIYAANAAAENRRLQALDAEIAALLAPVRDTGFLVFHDSLQYFARRYGLRALGSLTVTAERAPGARTMLAARQRLAGAGAVCAAAEPQTPAGLAEALVAGTGARLGVVDPLGSGVAPGPAAYAEILRNLAASLRSCLSPPA